MGRRGWGKGKIRRAGKGGKEGATTVRPEATVDGGKGAGVVEPFPVFVTCSKAALLTQVYARAMVLLKVLQACNDCELAAEGWKKFCRERLSRDGGGVCLGGDRLMDTAQRCTSGRYFHTHTGAQVD
eukprot:359031-Chlamydomonas_euryale.AAC.1